MNLFCYLRRALSSLRAGVGGPQQSLQGMRHAEAIAMSFFSEEPLSGLPVHPQHVAFSREKPLACGKQGLALIASDIDYEPRILAILTDRSRRRTGPLVLCLTGGN